MRWLGTLVDSGSDTTPPAEVGADWPCVTVGRFRLWHSEPAPASGLRRIEVPGCVLLVLGCCSISDAELAAVADRIARNQPETLPEVDGSRVVVAARHDDVLLVGDLAGLHVVFHAQTRNGRWVFSSDSRILATSVGSAVNRAWVALQLLMPTASDVGWTGTPWVGVHALRPGWVLHLDHGRPPQNQPGPRLPTPRHQLADAGSVLRSSLKRAVSARTAAAHRPTTDLSGGLDSSTIATLAARATGPIPALTLTTSGSDDTAMAALVAAALPRLAHTELDLPDSVLPYSHLDQLPALDEPTYLATTFSRTRWWLAEVAERGSDLHLSGDGGDTVLMAPPSYLADLVTPSRLPKLWQHATGWARLRHQAPYALVEAAMRLRATSYPVALRRAARSLRHPDQSRSEWSGLVSWFGPPRAAPWATREARDLVASVLATHAVEYAAPLVPGEFGIGDSAAWLGLNWVARTQRQYGHIAEHCGVNHHTPFLDDGVVRAC